MRKGILSHLLLAVCTSVLLGVSSLLAALPIAGDGDFQKVSLLENLTGVETLEIAPDGRIVLARRDGLLQVYSPQLETLVSSAQLPVYTDGAGGLLGIAFAPDFATSGWLYLYYSAIDSSVNRLSRFDLVGDNIDLSAETVLLEISVDRAGTLHEGGGLAFDRFGNLYLGTGDDTLATLLPAIDEFTAALSAERTSANSLDLRGKILRLTPQADGSYTIPAGNLFADPLTGLPEIYAMGARDPRSLAIDPLTSTLIWTDSGIADVDELNVSVQAGNFGWPQFIGANVPYTGQDASTPSNLSTWNSGTTLLPPAEAAAQSLVPGSYRVAASYRHDSTIDNAYKLPLAFDGLHFLWDSSTGRLWYQSLDQAGQVLQEAEWLLFSEAGSKLSDVALGPDHQLYLLDGDAGVLSRLDYIGPAVNQAPTAVLGYDVSSGALPLSIAFSAAASSDPDGTVLTYAWDFESDGIIDATSAETSFEYTEQGVYYVQLTVTDADGAQSVAELTVYAGNEPAVITFIDPPAGAFYQPGESVNVALEVTDAEDGATADGSILCSDVTITAAIGYSDLSQETITEQTCATTLLTSSELLITEDAERDFQLHAEYPDSGGLSSFAHLRLYPKSAPARYYDAAEGIQLVTSSEGSVVRAFENGAYLLFSQRNLTNIEAVSFRVASANGGGTIELRLDAATGPLLSRIDVPDTGSFDNWINIEASFIEPGDTRDLYLVFTGPAAATSYFDLSRITWIGDGVSFVAPNEVLTANTAEDADGVEGVSAPATLLAAPIFAQSSDRGSETLPAEASETPAAVTSPVNSNAAPRPSDRSARSRARTGRQAVPLTRSTTRPRIAPVARGRDSTRSERRSGSSPEWSLLSEKSAPLIYLQEVLVSPATPSFAPGAQKQFFLNGLDQYGRSFGLNGPPEWSATGGTIDANGVYTAGETAGTYSVTARYEDFTATATIEVENVSAGASGAPQGTLVMSATEPSWTVETAAPQWVYLDLGTAQNLSALQLSGIAGSSHMMEAQLSLDGTSWTTIYADTGTRTNEVSFPPLAGRYLRVFGSTSTLWELSLD